MTDSPHRTENERRWAASTEVLIDGHDRLAARLAEAEAENERLAALAGQHDPTGADHMEEMWVHAQRADAAEARLAEAERLLREGIEAFRLTREYVGEDTLPAIEGWSWFDWTEAAQRFLGDR